MRRRRIWVRKAWPITMEMFLLEEGWEYGGLWRWAALSLWLSRLHVCRGWLPERPVDMPELGLGGGGYFLICTQINHLFYPLWTSMYARGPFSSPPPCMHSKGKNRWPFSSLSGIFWENSTGRNLIKTGNSPPLTHPFKPPSLPPTAAPSPINAV